MERDGVLAACQDMDKLMKEVDRVDDIIEVRTGGNQFYLPNDFDSGMDSDEEMRVTQRCEAIRRELNCRGFCVELDENTPLKAGYLYLQYVALITEGLNLPEKHNIVFNGCGGWCEGCFQRSWCSVRAEVEKEEARLEAQVREI